MKIYIQNSISSRIVRMREFEFKKLSEMLEIKIRRSRLVKPSVTKYSLRFRNALI